MHLLLPPSETKNRGGRGRPLDRRPADGPLSAARTRVHVALADLLAGADRVAAAQALLLPAGVADEALRADATVCVTPTMPAVRRYAGTVYQGLSYESLTGAEQRVAARSTLVFSGLFGVLRGDEPVPDYRVPAKAVLPGVGVVSTFWRTQLTPVMAGLVRRGLIIDLRSGDYAAMWRPDPGTSTRVVTVRVLSPLPRGGHGVVSFASKLAKGQLAAQLVRACAAGNEPHDIHDVAAAWRACGGPRSNVTDTGLDVYTS